MALWIKSLSLAAAVSLFGATGRVSAHHAFAAEYDENKVVTVLGTVTSFKWTNPHAWLDVEGKDDSGQRTVWKFEMGSPNGMRKRGWKQTELKKGDPVTVDGYRSKKTAHVANARNVTVPDGRKLFGGFQSTPRAPGK